MRVYVARHAETNYNVLGLFNGNPRINVYLTPKGIEQGKVLAESLKNIAIELIITSEFPRTKETASLVNVYHNAPQIVDKRINDIVSGLEGGNVEEYRAQRLIAPDKWTFKLEGGESFEDIKSRVNSFLKDLKKRKEENILIVTHQITAKIIYGIINNISNEDANELDMHNVDCYEVEL